MEIFGFFLINSQEGNHISKFLLMMQRKFQWVKIQGAGIFETFLENIKGAKEFLWKVHDGITTFLSLPNVINLIMSQKTLRRLQ